MDWIQIKRAIESDDEIGVRKLLLDCEFESSDFEVLFKAAVKLYRRQKYGLCLQTIEKIGNLNNLAEDALVKVSFLKADTFFELREYPEAIRACAEIIQIRPSDIAYTNMGLAHWELGRYQEALDAYLRSIKLNDRNAIAHRGAGEMYLKLDKPAEAVRYFERALELEPDYIEASNGLGLSYFQLGNWPRAYEMFQKTIALNPDDEKARKGIALIEEHFEIGKKSAR